MQVSYVVQKALAKLISPKYSGLSPFLTALEVFTNRSRTARLLLAMYQFAKFDIKDLWYVLSSTKYS